MNRPNQSTVIKKAINSYLDDGVADKQDIYTKVVDELGIPRPTVRRVARDLRIELLQKIDKLKKEDDGKKPARDLRIELLQKIQVLQPKINKSTPVADN